MTREVDMEIVRQKMFGKLFNSKQLDLSKWKIFGKTTSNWTWKIVHHDKKRLWDGRSLVKKLTVLFNKKGEHYRDAAKGMQSYIGMLAHMKAPI